MKPKQQGNPLTLLIEGLAHHMCAHCAAGDHRRHVGSEWLHEDDDGTISKCDAGRMLDAAVKSCIPVYEGNDRLYPC